MGGDRLEKGCWGYRLNSVSVEVEVEVDVDMDVLFLACLLNASDRVFCWVCWVVALR